MPHTYQIRWQNFRSFEDTGWIRLKPITVFIGSNDSGKTSVHLPLIVGKQTLTASDEDLALKSRGDQVNVGGFRDFVRHHDSTQTVTLSIRWGKPAKSARPLFDLPPREASFEFVEGHQPGYESVLSSYSVRDRGGRSLLRRSLVSGGRYRVYGPLGKPIYRQGGTQAEQAAKEAIKDQRPTNFLFGIGSIFHAAVTATGPDDGKEEDGQADDANFKSGQLSLPEYVTDYMRVVDWTDHHVRALLENVLYVGPLRAAPMRVYQVSPEVPIDAGVAGEFAPELLFRNPDLLDGVRDWLAKFGVQGRLDVTQVMDSAFALELDRPKVGFQANLADVGFGISQALPVIVQALAASPDSVLVAEQPEIHLNPRLQARLADLFVEAASNGVTSVVETHSEYLLLRLRTLVARGEIDARDVAIYFVDRDTAGDSTLRLLPVQENGHIEPPDWPEGFFEDSLREAMALASAQSSRRS